QSRVSRNPIMTRQQSDLKAFLHPVQLISFVIFVGILLRLRLLLINNSLWLDEASLTLSVLSRNFLELTEPVYPPAPILFLWLMKATTLIGNASEVSLRFVPFLSGSGALIGFYFCSKEALNKQGALIAVALFAFSPELI